MKLWQKLFSSTSRIQQAFESGNLEKARTLLHQQPALAFARNQEGATLLHEAAYAGRKDIVALLLATKADVNARDRYGYRPLQYAAAVGYRDVADLLRQHGGQE